MSIGGIELRPAVWRAAFDDSSGADITAADDEAAAVALGYAAQLVCRCVWVQAFWRRKGWLWPAAAGNLLPDAAACATGVCMSTVPATAVGTAQLCASRPAPTPALFVRACRLSNYLGVPLRYPLCLLGSKSSILDGQPPVGTW